MTATRVLLAAALLALAGAGIAAPTAAAHYEVNVTVCFDVCTCATVVERESDDHVHTYCFDA